MARKRDAGSRDRATDTVVRDGLARELRDLRFSPAMHEAVRRATADAASPVTPTGTTPPAPRAERWAFALAAAAALALTSAVGVLYLTEYREPEPGFTVSNLPGAALTYNQRREP